MSVKSSLNECTEQVFCKAFRVGGTNSWKMSIFWILSSEYFLNRLFYLLYLTIWLLRCYDTWSFLLPVYASIRWSPISNRVAHKSQKCCRQNFVGNLRSYNASPKLESRVNLIFNIVRFRWIRARNSYPDSVLQGKGLKFACNSNSILQHAKRMPNKIFPDAWLK